MQGFELLDGDRLREFLVRIFAARTTLQLPPEQTLTWDAVGVRHGSPVSTESLQDFVQRARLCLDLAPGEFRKPGHFALKGEAVMSKKDEHRVRWAVLAAQGSREFAEQALAAKGGPASANRAAAVQQELQKRGLPRWDTQFQLGNVREAAGSRTGYAPADFDARIRGRAKKDILAAMRSMPDAGPFYVQHAIVLMTNLGSTATAKRQGIKDLDGACMLGDGAKPLLHLLLSEFVGFQVAEGLRGKDLENFAAAERERWRAVALAQFLKLGFYDLGTFKLWALNFLNRVIQT